MTHLRTDYTESGTEDLYLESLSDEEAAREMARQTNERLARIQAERRGEKDFTERLHPRDEHGRFTDTGSVSTRRSWEGFPFDERKQEGPRADDTPPERTSDGDFVMYHSTSPEAADAIRSENRLRPDDLGTVGLTTTPEAGRVYGIIHAGPNATTLRVTVSKDWLGQQRASHEIGGSGHDAFLIQPAHGQARAGWSGIPSSAILDIQVVAREKDFTERLHPRDEHGRFTDTGSLGDVAIRSGGFSLSLAGDRPHSGWMVSKFGSERSFAIDQLAEDGPMEFVPGNPWHRNFTAEIDRFVSDHKDELKEEGAYLGGWVDSGRLFLDVSVNIEDEAEAARVAGQNQQFAMFNAGTGEYREFEQTRRAASRGPAKDREKVLIKPREDESAESIARRLHEALFS